MKSDVNKHIEQLMEEAVAFSEAHVQEGGIPFSAFVIDRAGTVLGRGVNRVQSECDPTAHAEVDAIRDACRRQRRPYLRGAILLASGEPCAMCYLNATYAGIGEIYFAADRMDAADHGFDYRDGYNLFRADPKHWGALKVGKLPVAPCGLSSYLKHEVHETDHIALERPIVPADSFMRDGWDAETRFGAVVPHADVGPECELGAMGASHVSVHAGRLYFSAMRAGGEMDSKIPHAPVASFAEPPYVDEIVEYLAASPLDVIALAFTSSAYKHGVHGEKELVYRLASKARNIPITTTCLAAAAAFTAMGSQRIAMVNPPWFDDALDQAGADYFAKQGFSIVHHAPCGLQSGQRFITPDGLYDWVAKIVKEHNPDTIFIAGNGQRAVGIIETVERDLGVTLLTANQLILWHGLKLIRRKPAIKHYGKIFGTL